MGTDVVYAHNAGVIRHAYFQAIVISFDVEDHYSSGQYAGAGIPRLDIFRRTPRCIGDLMVPRRKWLPGIRVCLGKRINDFPANQCHANSIAYLIWEVNYKYHYGNYWRMFAPPVRARLLLEPR